MTAVTKAFGYVRVSGKGQMDGDGFRRQEAEIQAFATAHSYEVAKVYREEGISGTTSEADRPAFQDMRVAFLGIFTFTALSTQRVLASACT